MTLMPVTLSGYGASENVAFFFDGGPATQTFTADAKGSLQASVLAAVTWGNHELHTKGQASGIAQTVRFSAPATISLSPNSGPVGTVVNVTSGPGWVPGETVKVMWQSTVLKTVTADSTGVAKASITIPKHGVGSVTVKMTDQILGVAPAATFTITPG